MARFAFCAIFIVLLAGKMQCRKLSLKPKKSMLVSDGMDEDFGIQSKFLNQNHGKLFEETCAHIYGFLPCADNIGGYIFQVVVFECLLLAGDYLLSEASMQLFDIFGVGIYGAIVFRLLIMLPRIALILASGLSASHEDAQSMVVSSVGLTAGYTVFSLTLQWGVCVIFARTDICDKPESSTLAYSFFKKLLSGFTDSGVKVDNKTKRGAGVMLLSLMPFVMVQLSEIFKLSSWKGDVVLITLIVSILAVVLYFAYQFLDPSDQKRSLEYSRFDHLLAHFLRLIARGAKDKLVTNDGDPNTPIISRVLHAIDEDNQNKDLSEPQWEKLLQGISCGKTQVDKAYALAEFLEVFDSDTDGKVSKDEFIEGCERLINHAIGLSEFGESSSRVSTMELEKVVDKWIEGRRNELEQIPELMSVVFKHIPSFLRQSLLGDGKPDKESIERLFNQLDMDNDGMIQVDELEKVTMDLEFENIEHKIDEAVKNAFEDSEEDEDNKLDKQDYFKGITALLNEASQLTSESKGFKPIDEHHHMIWEKAAGIMVNKKEYERFMNKLFSRETAKASVKIIVGALIVIFLGNPLMTNIQLLSESIGIPSFIISFVVIPLAINIRLALSARFPARQKMERTASLTFSEIYGGVVMNNILGLSIILAIVYARGLMWDYSTEVLAVSMVGLVIGLLAFLRSTYPFWSCIVAFSLYPVSLFLVCVLHYVTDWD